MYCGLGYNLSLISKILIVPHILEKRVNSFVPDTDIHSSVAKKNSLLIPHCENERFSKVISLWHYIRTPYVRWHIFQVEFSLKMTQNRSSWHEEMLATE